MRMSLPASTGLLGSVYSSRLPLPLVSSTNGDQPCDFAASPVSSNILVLIQPATGPAPLTSTACRWRRSRTADDACRSRCRRRCTSSSSGSSIATWRTFLSIGNTLADGWSEPFLQKAGLSGRGTRRRQPDPALAVEHRVVIVDPGVPELLLAPIGRRRHRLDRRAAWPGPSDSGMFGSRTGTLKYVDLVGLRIEDRHVVGRVFGRAVQRAVGVDGRIAPVGRDQVVQVLASSLPQSQVVTTMLRSTPCGRGGLACGSSPLATRSVQSPKYL